MITNDDFNTTILYTSQYPGYINNDLDDENEKTMIDIHKEVLRKNKDIDINILDINKNNDDINDFIKNMEYHIYDDIKQNNNIENNDDINQNNNIENNDDINQNNNIEDDYSENENNSIEKLSINTQYTIKSTVKQPINKYNGLNTYMNNNIYTQTHGSRVNSDIRSKIDSNILNTSKYDINIESYNNITNNTNKMISDNILTNKYGHINNEERLIILENENKLLKQKIINTETKKMNDFYNIFVNPDSNIITVKNYILNYSREINNELSMFDLNSIEDDKIYILYKAIKDLKKKSSQIELSAHVIKMVLFFIETLSTKFLQTNILKDISKDLDIELNFNNTQETLNNILTIPDFPFKDIISHIIKKACINIGYEFGYEKLLSSIN